MNSHTIILNQEQKIYADENISCTKNYDIVIQSSWEYACCLVSHDAAVQVMIHSDVPDVKLTIVCINYATQDKPVQLSLDAQTNNDNVQVDVTLLSLAGKWSFIDIQWGITMPSWVQKTQWYLLEDTILLDPSARVKVLPKLDIHACDVKASHGAKIHAINDTELFYMQAKWLSLATSKKLYIQWYIQNLFDKIPWLDPDFVQHQHDTITKTLTL